MLPDWHYHYDGDDFNIQQDPNDGSISVANIEFWHKKTKVRICTGLNSKDNWPMLMQKNDSEYYLFSEDGEFMPTGAI